MMTWVAYTNLFLSVWLIYKNFNNFQWPHNKLKDDKDIYCNSALIAWTKEENVIENSVLKILCL